VKVGDLVRPIRINHKDNTTIVESDWLGIIIGFTKGSKPDPVVYWNEEYSAELEAVYQIEVVDESKK
jgi:hypothetical protein